MAKDGAMPQSKKPPVNTGDSRKKHYHKNGPQNPQEKRRNYREEHGQKLGDAIKKVNPYDVETNEIKFRFYVSEKVIGDFIAAGVQEKLIPNNVIEEKQTTHAVSAMVKGIKPVFRKGSAGESYQDTGKEFIVLNVSFGTLIHEIRLKGFSFSKIEYSQKIGEARYFVSVTFSKNEKDWTSPSLDVFQLIEKACAWSFERTHVWHNPSGVVTINARQKTDKRYPAATVLFDDKNVVKFS